MNEVAKRDKEMAEAQLGYATISAPFDGVDRRAKHQSRRFRSKRHDGPNAAADFRRPGRSGDHFDGSARRVCPVCELAAPTRNFASAIYSRTAR